MFRLPMLAWDNTNVLNVLKLTEFTSDKDFGSYLIFFKVYSTSFQIKQGPVDWSEMERTKVEYVKNCLVRHSLEVAVSTSKVMLALLLLPVRIFYDEKRPNCDQSFVAKVAIQANPVVEATNPSVDLTVYFESLCPDSIRWCCDLLL